ncbi:MAG: hypothetical protein JSR85_08615 [Proteobacteria bacterium]|nr:hypothetical protein [Pseudomonadota bacterium]
MISYLKKILPLIALFLIASSCGSRSLDDFEEEGEGVTRSLIQELKAIHTRDQLLVASSRLQRQFDRLVTIIIAAEEFSLSHPELEKGGGMRHNHELSDQLRVELNRLYRLEGGRQMIEKCEEKALHRLDAFQKRSIKN